MGSTRIIYDAFSNLIGKFSILTMDLFKIDSSRLKSKNTNPKMCAQAENSLNLQRTLDRLSVRFWAGLFLFGSTISVLTGHGWILMCLECSVYQSQLAPEYEQKYLFLIEIEVNPPRIVLVEIIFFHCLSRVLSV